MSLILRPKRRIDLTELDPAIFMKAYQLIASCACTTVCYALERAAGPELMNEYTRVFGAFFKPKDRNYGQGWFSQSYMDFTGDDDASSEGTAPRNQRMNALLMMVAMIEYEKDRRGYGKSRGVNHYARQAAKMYMEAYPQLKLYSHGK